MFKRKNADGSNGEVRAGWKITLVILGLVLPAIAWLILSTFATKDFVQAADTKIMEKCETVTKDERKERREDMKEIKDALEKLDRKLDRPRR